MKLFIYYFIASRYLLSSYICKKHIEYLGQAIQERAK